MSFSEQDIVLSVVRKLGGFFIEDRVSSSTTHVIAGSPRRTLNVLMAIAQGCWLVSPVWVRTPLNTYTTSEIEHGRSASTGLRVRAGRVDVVFKHDPKLSCVLSFGSPFVIPWGEMGEGGTGNKLIQRCLMIIVNRFASGQRVTFRTFWNTLDQRLIQVTLSFNIVSSCNVSQAIPITSCHSNVDRNC